MELDGMDSNVLGLAGCALSDIGQASRAMPILRQSIELNPNNSPGTRGAWCGAICVSMTGRPPSNA